MKKMTPEEIRALLTVPVRTGKLATVRPDGRPHVVPIWFALDGDDVVLTTGAESVKGRNLRRDPRASLCVDDDQPPFAFVAMEGEVELSDDADALLAWAITIAGRYMGEDLADQYGRRNGVPGELLVRFHPRKVLAVAGVSD